MDDKTPEHLTPEELLSAYLDGEVTGAQRAQVEQMLAADPEARATLEELRSLSSALQALPKSSVGEDLSERVLRRAERAMLERQTSDVAAPATVDKRPTIWERGSHGAGWARRLAWPAAAIAATLLIMLVNRKPQPELALAPVNSAPAPQAAEPDGAIVGRAPKSEAWEMAAKSDAQLPAGKAFKPGPGWAASNADADKDAVQSEAVRADTETLARQEFKAADRTSDADAASGGLHAKRQTARSAPNGAAEKDRRSAKSAERQLPAAGQPALAKAGPADAQAAGSPLPGSGFSQLPADNAMPVEARDADNRLALVVELAAGDEAAEVDAFDQLLAMQNIRMDDSSVQQRRKQLPSDEHPAEANEQEKKSGINGLAGNQPTTEPSAPRPTSPLAVSGNKPNAAAGEGAPAPAAEALSAEPQSVATLRENAAAAIAKKSTGNAEDKSGQGGGGFGGMGREGAGNDGAGKKLGSPDEDADTDVEVVLVTASPQQVRGLLKQIDSRAAQLDAVAQNRAPGAEPPPAPPVVAEEAKASASDAQPAGYAVRWRVNEGELAALLAQQAANQQAELGQIAAGEPRLQLAAPAAESLNATPAEMKQSNETPEQKRQRESEDRELAEDRPLEGAALRSEAAQRASKSKGAEKSEARVELEAAPAADALADEAPGKHLKGLSPDDARGKKGEPQSAVNEQTKSEVEAPAATAAVVPRDDVAFNSELDRNQTQRAQLEEQLRAADDGQQIRVLFVLRGTGRARSQQLTGAAGQSVSGDSPQDAATPAPAAGAPAAESAPAPAAPAEPAPAKE